MKDFIKIYHLRVSLSDYPLFNKKAEILYKDGWQPMGKTLINDTSILQRYSFEAKTEEEYNKKRFPDFNSGRNKVFLSDGSYYLE